MNELLKRVESFYRPCNDLHVQKLIEIIGETPSIETLEAVLKHYKAALKKILSKDLLEWMNEKEQTTFETKSGLKVSINTFVSSKVIDEVKAFQWLRENQYGDAIKDTLAFPAGDLTEEAEKALEEMGLSYTKKSGIPPSTLKKFMRLRLEAGELLPDEEDGIKIGYYDECVVKEK